MNDPVRSSAPPIGADGWIDVRLDADLLKFSARYGAEGQAKVIVAEMLPFMEAFCRKAGADLTIGCNIVEFQINVFKKNVDLRKEYGHGPNL